jgi:hypothetical protein
MGDGIIAGILDDLVCLACRCGKWDSISSEGKLNNHHFEVVYLIIVAANGCNPV